jgi:hypothetical protein
MMHIYHLKSIDFFLQNLQYGVPVDGLEEKQKSKAAIIRRINETKRNSETGIHDDAHLS